MVKQLTSSKDICDAIIKRQEFANLDKLRLNALQKTTSKPYEITKTKAFVIPLHSNLEITCKKLIIYGLKKYYNFFTDETFKLKTHLMSDQFKYIQLHPSIESSNITVERNDTIIDKIKPVILNNEYLNSKMLNWKLMQRNRNHIINNSEISSDNDNCTGTVNIHCKQACLNCIISCKFRLSEFIYMTKIQTLEELKMHGHPKSRIITLRDKTKRNRSLEEAKEELRSHYLKNHHFR